MTALTIESVRQSMETKENKNGETRRYSSDSIARMSDAELKMKMLGLAVVSSLNPNNTDFQKDLEDCEVEWMKRLAALPPITR